MIIVIANNLRFLEAMFVKSLQIAKLRILFDLLEFLFDPGMSCKWSVTTVKSENDNLITETLSPRSVKTRCWPTTVRAIAAKY